MIFWPWDNFKDWKTHQTIINIYFQKKKCGWFCLYLKAYSNYFEKNIPCACSCMQVVCTCIYVSVSPQHIYTHIQSVWVGIWMMQCDLVLSGIKFPWFSFIVSRRHPTKRNFKSRCSLLGVVWSSSVSAFKDAFFSRMFDSVASLSQNKTRFYYGKKNHKYNIVLFLLCVH